MKEINKKVRCVDSTSSNLIEGDIYIAYADDGQYFYLEEFRTNFNGWLKTRFDIVEDNEPICMD
jgi:hypothetical protein